nr:hypothetical protein [Tanacetum cinerariifolium]
MGEGSAQPTDTQHTPTFDMPPHKSKKTQKPRQPKRKTTKVPQPSESKNSLVRATTTAFSLEAEQDSALDKEDISKQGRLDEIDADEGIALVSTHDDTQDNIMQDEGIEDVGEEEVVEVVTTAKMVINTVVDAAQDTTAIADIPRERAKKEQEENDALINTWDDIQAKIYANAQLAQGFHEEEQLPFTDDEKARFLWNLKRKEENYLLQKKAEEKINKPLTKAQQRSIMSTYLKNMDGWKPRALKNKSCAEIQELFDKAMKKINSFINFRTELVEESTKKDKAKTTQESNSKREGDKLDQERSKKQKVEDDKESEELRKCLEIIPYDGDEVTIDAIPLSSKSPTIVDYKIYQEGKKEDLEVLCRLVKDRFEKVMPVNHMDSFLLHNLKTMFEHHVEDNVWKNQQGLAKLKNWKLFDSCRVYRVTIQNILYYLLVEKMIISCLGEDCWDIKTKDFIDVVKDYYFCWSSWKRLSDYKANNLALSVRHPTYHETPPDQ